MFPPLDAGKSRRFGEYGIDVFGVIGPVRRNVKRSLRLQAIRAQVKERRLNDASFVMTFLWPGIRKVEVDAADRVPRDSGLKSLDRILGDQPQVRHPGLAGRDQAMAHAGLVHLYAQVISFRVFTGLLYKRVTIAEADFENARRLPAKHVVQVLFPGLEVQPEYGP